jgi:hypothetical protein
MDPNYPAQRQLGKVRAYVNVDLSPYCNLAFTILNNQIKT